MARRKKSFSEKVARTNKQLFVGREAHVQFFQENIKRNPDSDDFINIINIYGQGGVGKSTLTNRFLNIANTEKCYTAFVDTEDASLREVTATMNAIAETFTKEKHSFKNFSKRYKDYLQEKGKLEADPERPKGTFGKLLSASIKVGTKATESFVPGANLVTDHIPIDAVAGAASEWGDFVAKKLGNKDEVALVLNPLKILTPLWIEDLCNIPEDKNIALFFDTFEAANPALSQWLFDLFKGKYGDIPSFLLLVSGRSALEVNKWNHFANQMRKISLEAFTKEEAIHYLNQKNIHDDQLVESILSISGRLPVYLALLAEGQPNSFDELADPNEQIVDRFLKHIEDPLKRSLVLQAALPSQLNQDIIECLLPKEEQMNAKEYFEWLKERPFVEKRGGYWAYHPVVREILLRHQKEVSEKEWNNTHTHLANFHHSKTQKLEVHGDLNTWIEDINWCTSRAEEHFHLLCSDYKKNIPVFIQDIGNVIASFDFNKTLPFLHSINQVEKILKIQDWGIVLEEGIQELILDEERRMALPLFRKINASNWISDPESKSSLLFAQGVFEFNSDLLKGEQEKAIECYIKATEINPDHHKAFYNMGNAYRDKGEQEKAIECYIKATEINPDYHKAFYNMGSAYRDKGEQEKAIKYYRKAIEIKPNYHDAWSNVGWNYLLLLDLKQASFHYSKAWELSSYKSEIAAMNLGNIYLLQKQISKAIEWYKKSFRLWDNKNKFFEGLESDFFDLKMAEQGITKESYDYLILDLKKEMEF